jgi:D-arabinose 1-dehydrogenase-like Zn-dependent alcohol dehydrogenase
VPRAGELLVQGKACGICHSDRLVARALWPGLTLPRVPGHEIAGVVERLGEGVTGFRRGDRVGLGWHGGHDGTCPACLQGKFVHCQNQSITGIPGHLGLQFSRAMGFHTVAISHGKGKRGLAEQLGAHHYIDSSTRTVEEGLARLGGARVILATAFHSGSIAGAVKGLGLEGRLLIVAAPFEPIAVNALDLLGWSASVRGWASGSAQDSTETMRFAKLHNIKPMIEEFPLAQAQKAWEHVESGKVRFRSVLSIP